MDCFAALAMTELDPLQHQPHAVMGRDHARKIQKFMLRDQVNSAKAISA
jgi:hypothetical protein